MDQTLTPTQTLDFGLQDGNFETPEEALNFLQEMFNYNKTKEQQLRVLIEEHDKIQRLLDQDVEMLGLGLSNLNFLEIPECKE